VDVLPGLHTLVVSPDGPLHELPFDALRGPDGYVVDRWRVAIVPSASVLAARPRSSDQPVSALVVAAPDVVGFAALPFARDEAAIASERIGAEATTLLVGDAATAAALGRLPLAKFSVLHFASHAEVDDAVPLRSALLLAPDGGDGRWRADAIYRLQLDAALVVLSACRTSAGAQSRGEGVMSLARAFLYAGARATVATQWDIGDAAGPAFADAMYRQLGTGAPLVAAVAASKRELRRRDARPRDWAGYVLVGAPSTTLAIAAAAPPVKPPRDAIAAALLLAGLVGIWLLRRRPLRAAVAGGFAAAAAVGVILLFAPHVPSLAGPTAVRGATPATTVPARLTFFDGAGQPSGKSRILAAAPPVPPPGAAWMLVEPEAGSPTLTRLP
jgi:hypothetical protein